MFLLRTKSRSISYSFNVRSICTPFLVTILEFVSITMSLKLSFVFDGESCADVLEKKHFDLILLDVMLPKISGFELMDYIKGFDTPVIFITAKSDISDRVYGLNLGADDYITKPFNISELQAEKVKVLFLQNIGTAFAVKHTIGFVPVPGKSHFNKI